MRRECCAGKATACILLCQPARGWLPAAGVLQSISAEARFDLKPTAMACAAGVERSFTGNHTSYLIDLARARMNLGKRRVLFGLSAKAQTLVAVADGMLRR